MFRRKRAFRRRRSGLTMVEIVVSSSILGAIAVLALPAARQLYLSQLEIADLAQANLLARDLMQEILDQDYRESGSGGAVGVAGGTNRSGFDSIDDYDGWNSPGTIPPQLKDGTPIPLGTGWIRQVAISFVDPLDPVQTLSSDAGIKMIEVSVSRLGTPLVTRVSYATEY